MWKKLHLGLLVYVLLEHRHFYDVTVDIYENYTQQQPPRETIIITHTYNNKVNTSIYKTTNTNYHNMNYLMNPQMNNLTTQTMKVIVTLFPTMTGTLTILSTKDSMSVAVEE